MTLLLVEDDPADQLLIETQLMEQTEQHFHLACVSTLAEARAYLEHQSVDIILLDLNLPDSSGWKTFEAMQLYCIEYPVVLMSHLADEILADRAVRAGAQNYLIKGEAAGPLLTRLLLHAVKRKRLQSAHADRLQNVGRMLSGVMHEVGTPLAVILAEAQMLAHDNPGLEEASIIVSQCERMQRILQQMLSYAGRNTIYEPCAWGRLVHEAVALVATTLRHSERRARVEIQPGADIRLRVDRVQLQQVITNVLLNAVEAGATLIRLGWSIEDQWLRTWFEDDGPGISSQMQNRIFEAFATSKVKGTGLGLSISRQIVQAHRGRLEFDLTYVLGARFVIELPLDGMNPTI